MPTTNRSFKSFLSGTDLCSLHLFLMLQTYAIFIFYAGLSFSITKSYLARWDGERRVTSHYYRQHHRKEQAIAPPRIVLNPTQTGFT